MAIWPDLTWFDRVSGFGLCALAPEWPAVLAIKLPVELFNFGHQIGIKSRNLNTRFAKAQFPTSA
jgi:hypothetical protein